MEFQDLSLLLLLRLARISLPPVLAEWRHESIYVVDELHEIFAQETVDPNEVHFRTILRSSHDFLALRRSRPCMLDAWKRFCRLNPVLPPDIQAALLHWTRRRLYGLLRPLSIRDQSFRLLNASGSAGGWSWESHCNEVLLELHEQLVFFWQFFTFFLIPFFCALYSGTF